MNARSDAMANSWARQKWVVARAMALVLGSILLLACNLTAGPPPAPSPVASPVAAAAPAATTTAAPSPTAVAPTATPAPTAESQTATAGPAVTADQPVAVSGTFTYTNDFVLSTYYVEHAVALVDMAGFVRRDLKWEIPAESQTLGLLEVDEANKRGTFSLQLPARPRGVLSDVDHDGARDTGVQVFAVAYWPNLAGGPFSEGDDRSRGWPAYLASTVNDSENNDEVIGGKLVVWAPDDQQHFSTGFGADGRLFTDDDPVAPIPAGYAVIDLDRQPFAVIRDAEPRLTLYEPTDLEIKDYSTLSYGEAFRSMFDRVRREYAFNGIPGKEPAWDTLYAQLEPRVAEAERNRDAKAFYLALRDFTLGFKDGHVGLGGGGFEDEIFQERAGGGYGFALRELDDGDFVVVYVTEDGPADQAGIARGAEVTTFNGKPVGEAASAVQPVSGPFSTDFALRYQQVRYLVRAPVGITATVTFANPGQEARSVTLEAVDEADSFRATSIYRGFDPAALPVESRLLESGVGYIRVNSNYDDLNLIIRLFERALKTFEESQARGLIVDLRQNAGGAPLDLAGFLTDQVITLGQLQYYSERTGKFENEGIPDMVEPYERRYRFPKMAVMVDQACASACEIEAYAFSKVPGMIVVGQYPSSGTEAEVGRGQYLLPDGLSLQVSTGRMVLPDGSIFLEGTGVVPTLRVPITRETVLSEEDVVLERAQEAVLAP